LLKPYGSFEQAMQLSDVQVYIGELRKDYPPTVARGMLDSLRDLKQSEKETIPVTSPLLDLGAGPDLLMDEAEPLKIFMFRDQSPSGLPPTLPPEKFPKSADKLHRTVPPTLYEAHLPPEIPPPPRPKPTRASAAASMPAPKSPLPPPRPKPAPVPRSTPPASFEPARGLEAAVDATAPEPETEVIGATVCIFLFVVAAAAGLLLLYYAIVHPLVS
jgi:hypothetical protein